VDILNHPAFSAAIVVCVGAEYAYSRLRGLKAYDTYESFSNLVIIFSDRLLTRVTHADSSFLAQWLWNHRIFHFAQEGMASFALTFLGTEFFYYWAHRYNHGVNLGWATHQMHHAPTKYNLTLGYRLGVTKFFSLAWLVFLPLVLLGFSPERIALCAGIIFLYQFFLHTELVPRLGILEAFLNTPSNHRVHHGNDPRFYDKNLGGLTVIFDRIFGTYVPEPAGERLSYGLSDVMAKRNLFYEVFHYWALTFRSAWREGGVWRGFRLVFGSPAYLSERLKREAEAAPDFGQGKVPEKVPVLREAELG
jgi:sterol desaturase/sphingolipid hydroxylase (fatty acid hydroxylase superfamily)